jgi:hypothetical protein
LENRILASAIVSLFILNGACTTLAASDSPDVSFGVFTNPERVTILDYTSDAMEPFVSLDGKYLFFNDSNNPPPGTFTKLYYATRIDDVTFQFKSEIGGVNTTALDAVPSMDTNNKFYFVSTRSYQQTLSTIYWGDFSDGSLSNVALVPGISKMKAGDVNFDAGISPDGGTLYFVDGVFNGGSVPQRASIAIAKREGDRFVRLKDSAKIMRKINTGGLNYAACPTPSDLEFFFTRADPPASTVPAIYTATRSKVSKPFGKPVKIAAITGFVEAPTLSADGRSLYYHKQENGVFVIYRVTRP